jgi:tRNA threonylcarbamoyladenosine biosynthesis protein TsaB
MALILNIDTATQIAGVGVGKEGKLLSFAENREQKEHASWLHVAVQKVMRESGYGMRELQAVAVTAGPGSYTGLRVGMAAAKGFCYALGIPLITENTLKVMAFAAHEQFPDAGLLVPMLDARRMDVFAAVYRGDLTEVMPATAMTIDEQSFGGWLKEEKLSFFGEGSAKCKPIITSPRAAFIDVNYNLGYLGILSFLRYLHHEFTGLVYSEPAYTKEFYTHTKK